MGDNLAELRKQKEDIEILLSTLEEAFRDASITEEHYNEVKGKNEKKLSELNEKIEKLEKPAQEPAKEAKSRSPQEKEKPPEKKRRGRPRKPAKTGTGKKPSPPPAEPLPSTPPVTPENPPSGSGGTPSETPAEPQSDYSGIPQPLTDVAGSENMEEVKPEKAPGGVRTLEPGTLKYTAEEVKEMLGKVLREIRPQGIEVIPRVDKLEVQLEKVRAFLEAMKDERSGGKENIQRMTEEIGELRSTISGMDRKVSESDIKVSEISESIGDLRPQRFIKALEEEDKSIKMHDARLDKLDDLSSIIMKKLGQIEAVLKRLGSLEKIVNFSQEAAKRLLEIENREKRITRIADKIDGIFMELNKRLDEFALYKAKQDTLDELSQETMKSLDDMSTKLEKYAEKSDLELLKNTLESELVSIKTSSGTSPEVQKLQAQKTEIEGLIAMLDEQFKAGALPEADYKKTKDINLARIADIDKKISAARGGKDLMLAAAKALSPESSEASSPAPSAESWKSEKITAQKKTEEAESGPESSETGKKEPEAKQQPARKEPVQEDKDQGLLSELEDSLMKGLISREAFEKTKGLIGGAKKLLGKKGDRKEESDKE
jgi:predicted  nucleic acid-binding Zn-ribbon protein/ElaB/YqjD/DUF883 family membrane-anchored ribosome-binding protein